MKTQAGIWVVFTWVAFLAAWNVLFVVPSFGPTMHESDQAALLEGVARSVATGSLRDGGYYNFDKQFGTYWILATVDRMVGTGMKPDELVQSANLASIVGLNLALLVFGTIRRTWWSLAIMGIIALSPALLVHAPFVAGNYFALFFLSLEVLFLGKRSLAWLAPVMAFAAVASRADALLVQPALIWICVGSGSTRSLFRSPAAWGCVVLSLLAFALGRVLLSPETPSVSDFMPSFKPKVIGAFTVFGLGASAIILAMAIFAMGMRVWKASKLDEKMYYLAGIGAVMLPWLYYTVHLYSTRYWTVPLAILMTMAVSSKAEDFRRVIQARRQLVPLMTILLLAALVPLFVGIRMPATNRIALTLSHPTLMPSADSLLPMGAYLAHSFRPPDERLDHNQSVWLAALNADFSRGEGRPVQLLESPLVAITKLALYLRGLPYEVLSEIPPTITRPIYVEERLLRKAPLEPHSSLSQQSQVSLPRSYGVESVSRTFGTEEIVVLTPSINQKRIDLETLRSAMKGNDFSYKVVSASGSSETIPVTDGSAVAVFSSTAFSVRAGLDGPTVSSSRNEESGMYFVSMPSIVGTNLQIENSAGSQRYLVAESVLPSYMNIATY